MIRRWHWEFVTLKNLARHLESIDRDFDGEVVSVTHCWFWFRRSAFVVWYELKRP